MKNVLLCTCAIATTLLTTTASAETVKTKKNKSTTASTKSANNTSVVAIPTTRTNAMNSSNHFGDLQFIPRQGEITATAELSARPNKVTANYKGKDVISAKESNIVQEYKLKYGVLENTTAAISFAHYLSGKKETELMEQKKTINVKASGFTDPVFSGTYRVTEQRTDKLTTDLTLAFSPSLITAEEASEDKSGSRGRGAYMAQAKAEVGAKFKDLEATGNISLTLEGEREIKDLTSSEKFKIDSTSAIALGGAIRHEFTDKLATKGGVDLTFVGEDKRKSAGNSFYTMDSFTRLGFLVEGQYNIIPEKVLAKAQININSEGSRSLKLGDNKLEVDSSSSQVFLLGADFRF